MTPRPPARPIAPVRAMIREARARGQRNLSEYESARVLGAYGIPTARAVLVKTPPAAARAARRIGYPVVLKVCSAGAAHKTERGLVAVNLGRERELRAAFAALRARAGATYDGDFLVQEMVSGSRELMIGMVRDAAFGPCVMFGLGGVFTEVLQDVVFRVAPLRQADALAMARGIRARRLIGAIRGMKAVDLGLLSRSLMAVGRIGLDHPDVAAIDVNPLIVRGETPVAVDALVVIGDAAP